MYSKNANVFAAIPSLHAAYPLLTVLYGSLSKKLWLHVVFVLFTFGVWFSAVYSRHHYVLDVLAGGLCAIAAYLLYRFLSRRSPIDRLLDAYSKLIWIMMLVDFFVSFSFLCLWSDDPFQQNKEQNMQRFNSMFFPFLWWLSTAMGVVSFSISPCIFSCNKIEENLWCRKKSPKSSNFTDRMSGQNSSIFDHRLSPWKGSTLPVQVHQSRRSARKCSAVEMLHLQWRLWMKCLFLSLEFMIQQCKDIEKCLGDQPAERQRISKHRVKDLHFEKSRMGDRPLWLWTEKGPFDAPFVSSSLNSSNMSHLFSLAISISNRWTKVRWFALLFFLPLLLLLVVVFTRWPFSTSRLVFNRREKEKILVHWCHHFSKS